MSRPVKAPIGSCDRAPSQTPATLWREAAFRGRAGFTLVELMAALSAGLFVSMAVFALARQASGFYQNQLRMGDAEASAVLGFERLRYDLQRAGYLSPASLGGANTAVPSIPGRPDSARLRQHCDTTSTLTGPALDLASIQIQNGTALLPAALATANPTLQPQRLILAGSYNANDRFRGRLQRVGGSDYFVTLTDATGLDEDYGYSGLPPAAQADVLQRLFPVGVLVVLQAGERIQFATVRGVVPGASIQVNLRAQSQIGLRGECDGFDDSGGPVGFNPINFIEYSIRPVGASDASYQSIRPTLGVGPAYESSTRTELVRRELDPLTNDTTLAGTTPEVLAEFAFDLRFALLVQSALDTPVQRIANVPTMLAQFVGPVSTAPNVIRPEDVVGVDVWLSVRARQADRYAPAAGSPLANAAGTPFTRVCLLSVCDGTLGPDHARVRTVQSTIALRNHPPRRTAAVPYKFR